jgi:hypothetical protein
VILTVRSWQVDRRDHAEFARISEDEYWPLFEQLGGRALGIWALRVGGPERLVLMTRYDSLDHWLGTRAWGSAADKLKAISDQRDAMIGATDLVALDALSRRQPGGDAPEAAPGVYVWEHFSVAERDLARFRDLTEDHWLPDAEAAGGIRLVGIWSVLIGAQQRVYMLTRADSVAAWQSCLAANAHALEQRAAIGERTCVQLLYSVTRRRP